MISIATAAASWAITQLITSKGLELPGEVATAISTTAAAVAGWIVDSAAARIQNTAITQIQQSLPGVVEDGGATISGQTVQAVKMLAGQPMENPLPPIGANEAAQISRMLPLITANNQPLLHAIRQEVLRVENDLNQV